jgi:hypothetical protein
MHTYWVVVDVCMYTRKNDLLALPTLLQLVKCELFWQEMEDIKSCFLQSSEWENEHLSSANVINIAEKDINPPPPHKQSRVNKNIIPHQTCVTRKSWTWGQSVKGDCMMMEWAHLLGQQKPITVYRLPNENKLPISVFHLRKTNGSLPFPFFVCSKQTESGDIRRECPSLESVRVAELALCDCLISYRWGQFFTNRYLIMKMLTKNV